MPLKSSALADMIETTQDQQIRRTILQKIEEYDIEMLKRIAYEVRCEEMGIYPDQTYIKWWHELHSRTTARSRL